MRHLGQGQSMTVTKTVLDWTLVKKICQGGGSVGCVRAERVGSQGVLAVLRYSKDLSGVPYRSGPGKVSHLILTDSLYAICSRRLSFVQLAG